VTTTRFEDADPALDGFYRRIAEHDLQPLWTQPGPSLGAVPFHWPFAEVEPLMSEAGALVGTDRGGDRRVLGMCNPGLGGRPFATPTLWAAMQYLKPGESAPPHRHSPAALRFVLAGEGVVTLVDGEEVAMCSGDLVLTPSMRWHEHRNDGVEPMIWFDGLDIPLVRSLDADYFEPGPMIEPSGLPPATLRYQWADTHAALESSMAANGAASMRFVASDGHSDVMPTMRCNMHRLPQGGSCTARAHVGSSVFVVYAGTGTVEITGGRHGTLSAPMRHGDVVAVPTWVEVTWTANDGLDLFEVSDAPVIEALHLQRAAP
jgi:gentisate 1,2-dioxygenase